MFATGVQHGTGQGASFVLTRSLGDFQMTDSTNPAKPDSEGEEASSSQPKIDSEESNLPAAEPTLDARINDATLWTDGTNQSFPGTQREEANGEDGNGQDANGEDASNVVGDEAVPDQVDTLLPGQWSASGENDSEGGDQDSKRSGESKRPGKTGRPTVRKGKAETFRTGLKSDSKVDSADDPFDSARKTNASQATIDIPGEFRSSDQDFDSDTTKRSGLPDYVGKFRVERELGRGAFGVVYLARDEDLDRPVAIKLSLVEDATYQEKLRVEASKVAQVEGEHVVKVLHVDRTEFGAVYIVQNYVDGCTLGSLLQSGIKATPGQAMILIYQLALGLRVAHEKDILHRDLKPDNILLDRSGVPWIVDFGLAISENEQVGRRRELAGTPPYMSPEQIRGRVDFMDARSDIWSLGVILYELLTGKLPFTGRTRSDLTEQICERDPKPVQQHSPDTLTEDMNAVFRRCCAKEPKDRFSTVGELNGALKELIKQYATADDLTHPLGLDVQGVTSVASTPTGLEELTTVERGREDRSWRGRSTVFNTQRDATTGPATIGEMAGSTLARLGSVAAIAAVVVAIAFLVRDRMFSSSSGPSNEVATSQSGEDTRADIVQESTEPPPEETDPDLVPFDPSQGTRSVATVGPANHRTIQDAIDNASEDETIEVAPGYYPESLVFNKPIHLKAISQGDPNRRAEILGNGKSPLTVDCEGQVVKVEGFVISAQAFYESKPGQRTPSAFNVIDVLRGTLGLKGCEVSKDPFNSSDTFNNVKVHHQASLLATECEFLTSAGFSISARDHEDLRVEDCGFQSSGIQLVGGIGSILSCRFSGKSGIQVQQSRQREVVISDCTFERNQDWGISVTAGGIIKADQNVYRECSKGVWVGTQNELTDLMGIFGSYTASKDTFEDCVYAVVIDGGEATFQENCTFDGGGYGIVMTRGDLTVKDSEIRGCRDMGISTIQDTGAIQISDTTIAGCGGHAAYLEACHALELKNVNVADCGVSGVAVMGGRVDIDGLTLTNVKKIGLGITQKAEVSRCQAIQVKGCDFGIYVQPEQDTELAFTIRDSKFSECSNLAIWVMGNANVNLVDNEYSGFIGRRSTLARPPARITESEELDSETPSKDGRFGFPDPESSEGGSDEASNTQSESNAESESNVEI